jgi:hypothetical protein
MGEKLTFVVRREERRERGEDFNVEKGEGLFLPWISFPLPLPSFFMISTEIKKNSRAVPLVLFPHRRQTVAL